MDHRVGVAELWRWYVDKKPSMDVMDGQMESQSRESAIHLSLPCPVQHTYMLARNTGYCMLFSITHLLAAYHITPSCTLRRIRPRQATTAMKLSLALLACSALSLSSCVAAAADNLSSRLSKFHALASKNNGVVPLTSNLYDELLQDTPSDPRGYSVSIILTALNPKFGCQPCIAFDKEHKEAARQWWSKTENKKSKENQMRHVFAVLDFEKGQDIFKRVRLVCFSLYSRRDSEYTASSDALS